MLESARMMKKPLINRGVITGFFVFETYVVGGICPVSGSDMVNVLMYLITIWIDLSYAPDQKV